MAEYRVEWIIDVQAESPEAAAREAWAAMRDPFSEACYFTVFCDGGDGEGVSVDLNELNEPSEWEE